VTPRTRPHVLDDAPAIARLVRENRDFLAPWEPLRDEGWFTDEGQRDEVAHVLGRAELDLCVPRVVLDDGEVVGRITLSNIVRGAFQSCSLGYWLAQRATGRGVATAAVGEMLAVAFGDLGLHRVEAGTLVHNTASQRVLAAHGFVRFGLAPRYLRIAGRWQDHVLFQRLAP
jgi:[ribosomal protein S5]-alanine N-acetyltransferase